MPERRVPNVDGDPDEPSGGVPDRGPGTHVIVIDLA